MSKKKRKFSNIESLNKKKKVLSRQLEKFHSHKMNFVAYHISTTTNTKETPQNSHTIHTSIEQVRVFTYSHVGVPFFVVTDVTPSRVRGQHSQIIIPAKFRLRKFFFLASQLSFVIVRIKVRTIIRQIHKLLCTSNLLLQGFCSYILK